MQIFNTASVTDQLYIYGAAILLGLAIHHGCNWAAKWLKK